MDDQRSLSSSNDPFGLRRRTLTPAKKEGPPLNASRRVLPGAATPLLSKIGENIRRSSSSFIPSFALNNQTQQQRDPPATPLAASKNKVLSPPQEGEEEEEIDFENHPNGAASTAPPSTVVISKEGEKDQQTSRRTPDTATDTTEEQAPLAEGRSFPQGQPPIPGRLEWNNNPATSLASPAPTFVSQISHSPEIIRRYQQDHASFLRTSPPTEVDNKRNSTTVYTAPSTTSRANESHRSTRTSETQQFLVTAQLRSQLQNCQDELHRTRSQLQEQKQQAAAELQAAADQWKQQHQQTVWEELESAAATVEASQAETQARLDAWQEELRHQQASLQNTARLQQEEQTAADQKLANERQRLEQWQERLQTQLTRDQQEIQQRKHALQADQNALEESRVEFNQDKQELERAVQEVEAKNDAYERKYAALEQEMRQQRLQHEQEMQQAVAQRQDALAQAEQITKDSNAVKEAVRVRLQESQAALDGLEESIGAKRGELENLKARITLFVAEDQQCRQVAARETRQAEQQLDALLAQIQVAQREQGTLEASIAEKKEELQTLQDAIRTKHDEWDAREKALLLESERLTQLHSQRKEETDQLVQQTTARLETEASKAKARCESMERTLEVRVRKFDRLRKGLNDAIEKHRKDVAVYEDNLSQLKDDQRECGNLREDLAEQMARFASSEGREKRLRQEMDLEFGRLRSLVVNGQKDLEQQTKNAEEMIEEIREEHRRELFVLAERCSSTEAERDDFKVQLSDSELSHAQRTSEVNALRSEIDELKDRLSTAAEKTKRAEALVFDMEKKRDSEEDEREKVKSLMSRLEANSSSLETRLKEIEVEKEGLLQQKRDYQSRLNAIQEKEREIAQHRVSFDMSYEKLAKSTRCRQKAALTRLLLRPWRQEQEEVSAAFSKWVRVVLCDMNERVAIKVDSESKTLEKSLFQLQKKHRDSEESRKKWETEHLALQERARRLDQTHDALRSEIRVKERNILQLTAEISCLREEKDALLSKQNEGNREEYAIGSDSRNVKQRRAEIERKEKSLIDLENSLHDRDQQSVREMEGTQLQIRKFAEQLNQKEVELCAKEQQLESELLKNQTTQTRLQDLALMLRKKAQQLEKESQSVARRMEECDALESELHVWQNQLERLPNAQAQPER